VELIALPDVVSTFPSRPGHGALTETDVSVFVTTGTRLAIVNTTITSRYGKNARKTLRPSSGRWSVSPSP
jgi:hypothetical protein